VIRTDDKLGETLLATPVFRALKETNKELFVEAWLNPRWAYVVEASCWVDSLRKVPYRPRTLECVKLARRLRRDRPDVALILRPDARRHAWIAKIARIPCRVGAVQQRRSLHKLLTHVVSFRPEWHQVERNLAIAECFVGHSLPRFPLHFAPSVLATPPSGVRSLPEGGYAVLHLGTGGVQPRWLPSRFAEVANWLAQAQRLTPVLTGAPSEVDFAETCLQGIKKGAVNLVGKVTIAELAEVLKRAKLLISVDTGVVHLAAAVGTPCVSLHFRLDYPPHQWYAWQVPNEVVVPSEYCRRCTPARCGDSASACVSSVQAEAVIEATERLLARI